KNEAAKQWLLRHPRVHFHYIPTHASWMNMIECFFSILTRQALTQSVHRSKKDLKDFLHRYLKKYSENPTPFTWTKAPEHLQRIIEATKEYQTAHPKEPLMPISDKQLAANRANAAKSTGPRTPEGKARSARNARIHGFTASSFTVVRLEDLDEIARLKADAVSVYQPVNSQEMFALEQ